MPDCKFRKIFLLVFIIIAGVLFDRQSDRINRLERELSRLRGIPLRLYQVENRTAFLYGKVVDYIDSSGHFRIVSWRSSSSPGFIKDALLSGRKGEVTLNWGEAPLLGAGVRKPHEIYRSVLEFPEFLQKVPSDAHILAATVYLRQQDNGLWDNGAANQMLSLHALRKPWQEVTGQGRPAHPGEVSWIFSGTGEAKWLRAGAGDPHEDYDAQPAAITGRTVEKDWNDRVAFLFTEHGMRLLETWLQGPNRETFGFLLKAEREDQAQTFVTFLSSDAGDEFGRPLLEVIYSVPYP